MKNLFRNTIAIVLGLLLCTYVSAQTNGRIFGPPSEGVRSFLENGKMGFVDMQGKTICAAKFDYPDMEVLPYFREGLCMFFNKKDPLETNEIGNVYYGFIDRTFKEIIPAIYPYSGLYCDGFPSAFSSGYAIVSNPNPADGEFANYLVIDKTGKQVGSKFDYEQGCTAACVYYPEIFEGLTIKKTKYGVTYAETSSGKEMMTFSFSVAGPFCGGVAAVEVDGKYITLIDKTGRPVTDKKFFTLKNGSSEKSIYGDYSGCRYLGGFVKDRMVISYYDNNGAGPQVYALIDKTGRVVLKKQTEDVYDDPDFEPYQWNFGRPE